MPNINPDPLKKYTYIWKLFDFGLHQGGVKLSIFSSIFHLKTIQKTRWRLHLVNDEDDETIAGIEIFRLRNNEITYELREIIARVTFKILAETDIFVIKRIDEISFSVSQKYTVKDFFDIASICELLIDNTLTVIVELELSPKMCNKSVNYNNDCEMFSLDMQMLYETKLYSDVIIYTTENSLKAHRAILEARWPGIVHLINEEFTPVTISLPFSSSVLTSILKYVYTGKLEFEELSPEFYKISTLYNFNLNELLVKSQSVPDEIICQTCFNTLNATIDCSLNEIMNMELNSLPFTLKVSVENLLLTIDVLIDPENKDMQLILQFPDVNLDEPVHISCTMSIFADNDLVASREDDQIIVNNLSWNFPSFFSISEISTYNLLGKKLTLLCDCKTTSVTYRIKNIDTYIEIEEKEQTIEDKLGLNIYISVLLGNKKNSDLEIFCGENHYYAHRSILSCRSPKFREMIEKCISSDNKVIHVTDIAPNILNFLLQYIYGTLIEDSSLDLFSSDLLTASLIYQVKSLTDKCKCILSNSAML